MLFRTVSFTIHACCSDSASVPLLSNDPSRLDSIPTRDSRKEDLPQPVSPITATKLPFLMCSEMASRQGVASPQEKDALWSVMAFVFSSFFSFSELSFPELSFSDCSPCSHDCSHSFSDCSPCSPFSPRSESSSNPRKLEIRFIDELPLNTHTLPHFINAIDEIHHGE